MVGLMVTSSKRADAAGYVCDPGLLPSEPMAVWQATADLSLRRGHSHTQRQARPLRLGAPCLPAVPACNLQTLTSPHPINDDESPS